jgi:hypothetical protein
MLRGKAVDRDDHMQVMLFGPVRRDPANRARHQLNLGGRDARQQRIDLTKPDKRFPSHKANVQGTQLSHEGEHTINQGLPGKVGHVPQSAGRPRMTGSVRVAARATQGALARQFDG